MRLVLLPADWVPEGSEVGWPAAMVAVGAWEMLGVVAVGLTTDWVVAVGCGGAVVTVGEGASGKPVLLQAERRGRKRSANRRVGSVR
jgi:hypothetical protein